MSLVNQNIIAGAGAQNVYQISRSVRLRSSASAYFVRTFSASGTTVTFSKWFKRGALSTAQHLFGWSDGSSNSFGIALTSSDTLDFYSFASGAYQGRLVSTQVFRDPSAFYHLVCTIDTSNATAANRMRVFVNGVQITAFSTATYPTQNASLIIGTSRSFVLGAVGGVGTQYFDGYLTDINFIDGQALTPSAFGETDAITGVWKPRRYTGTYGTNGFFLNFSDPSAATAAAIGRDYSGNGNNWTPNNISVTAGATYDSMLDVPTPWADGGNGRGNYAVLNPLARLFGSPTFADGNLRTTAVNAVSSATMNFPSTGKWYFEATVSGLSTAVTVGICNTSPSRSAEISYQNNGNRNAGGGPAAYGATYTTNDVIGVAVDCDAATVTFYKNNVSQGSLAFSLSSLSSSDIVAQFYTQAGSDAWIANFGQRPFAYTPPTGFRALNTQNLPEPTIVRGNRFMDAITYTGNGVNNRSITGLGFQPDLIWTKARSVGYNNNIADAVRGVNRTLYSNTTDAEATNNGAGYVSAFNADGYTVTQGVDMNQVNANGTTYVSWNWREGATQGFDIVTYTGTAGAQNISHSLGVAPAMIITKVRNNPGGNWGVYHRSIGNTGAVFLNTTNATATSALYWNNTSPTSSVFSVGSNNTDTNWNTYNFVAYLFSEVAGFSRFGSYTGNGSADGPFVFCGFRPRFVMVKRTDTTANWGIADTARSPINAGDQWLFANLSDAEYAGTLGANIDVLSNGFKLRIAGGAGFNTNGGTYIFAAFAENPFKYSLAR